MSHRILLTLATLAILANAHVQAEEFLPTQFIFVSDNSERDFVADDLDAGPLDDDAEYVARERANIDQDNLQIRTFIEFDVSSLSSDTVAADGFLATLSVDFVTRLNTVNNMAVLVGRVLDDGVDGDTWGTEDGDLPLFEWARLDGETEALAADPVVLLPNVRSDPLGNYKADVTSIVRSWVEGENENNGFVLFGDSDQFQGAGLSNALLTTGLLGDFDDNGIVDVADFQILSGNLAAHIDRVVLASDGDIDLDGDVDLDDFGQFKAVFPAVVAQAVPEPSAMGLLLVGLAGMLQLRRIR